MGQVWQELFAESFRETMHGIAVFLLSRGGRFYARLVDRELHRRT